MSKCSQISLFDYGKQPLKISKPVRLIELFAGIGSQAKALKKLGVNFEHYRVCEFDKYAIGSYNAIHNTDFKTSDITQLTAEDLKIVDTDSFTYLLTYSFPCQDLSLAGKQKGMSKGKNTRSGLLWEVERLLNECRELPQILLMENVTQVHNEKNMEDFREWLNFLESKGYSNYWKDLNAKDYGIPQNRNRTFMVSVLGDYTYEFPNQFPLELRLKDFLENEVDEKFYLSDKGVNFVLAPKRVGKYTQILDKNSPIASALTAKGNANWTGNFINDGKCIQVAILEGGKWDRINENCRRVYSPNGCSPTIHTCSGGNTEPKIIQSPHGYNKGNIFSICPSITSSKFQDNNFLAYDEQNGYIREDGTIGTLTTDGSSPKHNDRVIECGSVLKTEANFRIRKLTPKECFRLMGFDEEDFEKAAKVNSNSQLYKQAGNSIVVDVLYYIFKEMF